MNFKDTILRGLYIQELWWLAHGVKTKAEYIFAETMIVGEERWLKVDPEIHSVIASLLSDAANLRKLIVEDAKRRSESEQQYKRRKKRVNALNEIISGIKLNEIKGTKVRNTLEHFDEYLDETNYELTTLHNNGESMPSPMVAHNVVLSHWEFFSERVYPIRLYISSERKFYNMKWCVDIGAMHQEASSIVECLTVHHPETVGEKPGGAMIRLSCSPKKYGK